MKAQRWTRALAVMVLAVAACASCSSDSDSGAPRTTTSRVAQQGEDATSIQPGSSAEIAGIRVTVADGSGEVRLTGSEADGAPADEPGFELLSAPALLEPSTPLGAPLTLSWPVPDGVPTGEVLVATVVDGEWTPVATTIDPSGTRVETVTDHLSIWAIFHAESWRWVPKVIGWVKDLLGFGVIGEAPKCPDPLPADRARIDSSGSGSFRVEVCSYADGDALTVRLANRRAVSVVVPVPQGASRTAQSIPGAGDLAAEVLTAIEDALDSGGTSRSLIPSGGWIELTWPRAPEEQVTSNLSIDNSALVWSLLFMMAGNVEGGWKVVSAVAESADFSAAVANTDAGGTVRSGLGAFLERSSELKGAALKVPKKLVAAFLGAVTLGIRGIIDTFRSFTEGRSTLVIEPAPASGGDVLPTVQIDQVNVARYEQLLEDLGYATDSDEEAACTSLTVLGVDFASRSADILNGYSVDGERGYHCDGDSTGTITRIRNGEVVEEAFACGDCDPEFAPPEELERYRAIRDAYRGRTAPTVLPWVTDDGWGIWSYENELIE